mmetsp:Transcript_20268/g.44076  ORF Transcript_20268/g.44076 Transcript_20268/m.44076 type:complete len:246 (+) Transcript_20268:223-960(+)|eukprot:CAMPEP_0172321724 /NCGR_PEP_ID=MMETSP1058-20130122/44140_1 /TAXON_ID=83371 /ORGANISM="Detonula confervacea, Strain CCMP 353" /LENGTH=245 /DNA_ID=CAMNT_0013037309 /DNA_START=202 /DNA_END=939 /DNA_ORIENTATION=+
MPTSTAARQRQISWISRVPLFALLLIVGYICSWNNNDGASLVVSAADASSSIKQQGVITLNSKNFDSSLSDGKAWLIEFYAPWCGHCTRFAPTYELVANQLHSDQKTAGSKRKVNVAKVDGAAERALSSRFGVHGYPTFVLVDGWTVREFEGSRTPEGLVQFALTDYEKTEPVPFLFGPFGPMGQLRSFLMRTGTWAVGLYENLTLERGMKPLMAMAVLCVGGLVLGLVSIIVVGLLFLPKAKQD